MSAYRFPPVDVPDATTLEQQIEHVKSEVREAKRAEIKRRFGKGGDADRMALCMELLDIIHAAETALRMEFGEDEVEEGRARVIAKNARRGYYRKVD